MTKQPTQRRNYALPIAIMFCLFFMIAFVTGYQNPLGSVIEKMSGGNVVFSQLGTLANFIAYLFMGYPAGKLLEKYGYRITALAAVSVGFAGVLITYLSGFIAGTSLAVSIYLVGAFVAGFSMCMLNTVVNPMLNSLGKDQKQGNQLVQFGGTCNSLGATLAPVIVGGLIGGTASTISSANPVFFMAMGIFAAAFLVLYFSKLPESPDLGKKKEALKISDALKFSNLTWGLVAIFCYIGVEVGIANFTLKYLEKSEIVTGSAALNGTTATAIAGTVVAIYWLMMLVGRFIGGLVGGKVTSRAMVIATSLGCVLLTVIAMLIPENSVAFFGFDTSTLSFTTVTIPTNAVLLVAVGLCTSVQWGAIFNLAVQGVGKYTAVASGLFMAMVCGGGIFPTLQGWLFNVSALGCFIIPVVLAAYIFIYAVALSKPKRVA